MYRTYQEKETISDCSILSDTGTENIVFRFHAVELPWKDNQHNISCIPEGKYILQKEKPNSHFNYDHFSVLNVKDRGGIKIHIANYVSQLRGCIAPGKDLIDMNSDELLDVTNSGAVLKKLVELLPEESTLEIYKA